MSRVELFASSHSPCGAGLHCRPRRHSALPEISVLFVAEVGVSRVPVGKLSGLVRNRVVGVRRIAVAQIARMIEGVESDFGDSLMTDGVV